MVTVYSGYYTVSSISGLFSLMCLSAGVEKTASPLRSGFFFSEWDEELYRRATSITDMSVEVSDSSPVRED